LPFIWLLTQGEVCVHPINQGCGSGSGLDPDLETCVDPDPYWEKDPNPDTGARKLRNFSGKNELFSYF
jgi:hypothetical protein